MTSAESEGGTLLGRIIIAKREMGSTVSTVRVSSRYNCTRYVLLCIVGKQATSKYEDILRSSFYFAAPPEMLPTAAMSCKSIYTGTKIRRLNTANGTVAKNSRMSPSLSGPTDNALQSVFCPVILVLDALRKGRHGQIRNTYPILQRPISSSDFRFLLFTYLAQYLFLLNVLAVRKTSR
jgi:hypothetical protein